MRRACARHDAPRWSQARVRASARTTRRRACSGREWPSSSGPPDRPPSRSRTRWHAPFVANGWPRSPDHPRGAATTMARGQYLSSAGPSSAVPRARGCVRPRVNRRCAPPCAPGVELTSAGAWLGLPVLQGIVGESRATMPCGRFDNDLRDADLTAADATAAVAGGGARGAYVGVRAGADVGRVADAANPGAALATALASSPIRPASAAFAKESAVGYLLAGASAAVPIAVRGVALRAEGGVAAGADEPASGAD